MPQCQKRAVSGNVIIWQAEAVPVIFDRLVAPAWMKLVRILVHVALLRVLEGTGPLFVESGYATYLVQQHRRQKQEDLAVREALLLGVGNDLPCVPFHVLKMAPSGVGSGIRPHVRNPDSIGDALHPLQMIN